MRVKVTRKEEEKNDGVLCGQTIISGQRMFMKFYISTKIVRNTNFL